MMVEGVQSEAISRAVIAVTQEMSLHQGPLPPPGMLAEYERVVPGLGARIVEQWESETKHRREYEKTELKFSIDFQLEYLQISKRNSLLGIVLGFLLGFSAVAGGLLLAYSGRNITGFGIFFSGLAMLLGAFIFGHSARHRGAADHRDGDAPTGSE